MHGNINIIIPVVYEALDYYPSEQFNNRLGFSFFTAQAKYFYIVSSTLKQFEICSIILNRGTKPE